MCLVFLCHVPSDSEYLDFFYLHPSSGKFYPVYKTHIKCPFLSQSESVPLPGAPIILCECLIHRLCHLWLAVCIGPLSPDWELLFLFDPLAPRASQVLNQPFSNQVQN